MYGHAGPRCVFICFETRKKLDSFCNSNAFFAYQNDALVLTEFEEVGRAKKNSVVKRAPVSTKAFGRGTDFSSS